MFFLIFHQFECNYSYLDSYIKFTLTWVRWVSDSAAGIGCYIAMSQDSVLLNQNANFLLKN